MTQILMYCTAVIFGVFLGAIIVSASQLTKQQQETK